MSRVAQIHHRWSQRNRRARLVEYGIGFLCALIVIVAATSWGLPRWSAVGLAAGAAAIQITRWLRGHKTIQALARDLDGRARTGWLLQTALAVERNPQLGAPDMARAVLRRAERIAPKLEALAVRPFSWPWPNMVLAGLALLSMLIPQAWNTGQTPSGGRSIQTAAATTDPALPEALTPTDSHQLVAINSAGLGGSGEDGVGGAKAGGGSGKTAARGDTQSQRGTSTGSGAKNAASPPPNVNEEETASQQAPSEEEQTLPPTALRAAGGYQPGQNRYAEPQKGFAPNRGIASKGLPGDEGQEITAPGGEADGPLNEEEADADNPAKSANASAEESSEGEAGAADGASSSLPMGSAPDIGTDDNDRIWDPMVTGAGMGGINDAAATEDGAAGTGRDRANTAEEWVEGRWRASPEGLVRTIEGGQTGGKSQIGYDEVYSRYAEIADVVVRDEAIPPGRRAYIRRYFETIRPEQESTDDRRATDPTGR